MEVKADALEESFATLQPNDEMIGLRSEIDALKVKLRQNLVAAARPELETEQKSAAQDGFGAFLRSGEPMFEGKSADNSSEIGRAHV